MVKAHPGLGRKRLTSFEALKIPIRFLLDDLGQEQEGDEVGDGHEAVGQIGEVPDEVQLHQGADNDGRGEDQSVAVNDVTHGARAAQGVGQVFDGLFGFFLDSCGYLPTPPTEPQHNILC